MSEIWIQPTGGALGADVYGVDLSKPVSDADFKKIAEAWGEHLVLRFSGQKIDDPTLMKFSARFGELDRVPIAAVGFDRMDSGVVKDAREWVAVIASVKKDGKAIGGLGSYELVWHTDMSYNPLPPRASLLYALEVPPDGGNTGFLNMYAAYETLPDDLKRAIEGKTCIHDSSRNSAGELRKGFQTHASTSAKRRAPCIPSSACIRSPSARRCSSAAGPAPTSTASASRRARSCSTRCGRTPRRSASPGTRSGASAIS